MTLIKKMLFVIFILCNISNAAYSQNLLDYQNSLKYADYLFMTGQYELAAVEFERVVFLEPKDTLAKLKLVQSYRYLSSHSIALNKIEVFFPNCLEYLPEEFSDEYVKNLLYERRFQESREFLCKNITLYKDTKFEYQLGALIMEHKWPEAKSVADDHADLISENMKYGMLYDIACEGLKTPYKNPVLAASLSAILPGTGKIYTGQWKDAIYSFLFVSAGLWLSYHSYSLNGLGVNSIFWGSITIGFYSANIYGSYKSAKRFNQRLNQSYTEAVEVIILK